MEYLHERFGWRKKGRGMCCFWEKFFLFTVWKKKELGNASRGSVHGLVSVWAQPSPSRALGKQNLTEGNVIFGGSYWKRQLRAALNPEGPRANVKPH